MDHLVKSVGRGDRGCVIRSENLYCKKKWSFKFDLYAFPRPGDEFQIYAIYAECSPQGCLHFEVLLAWKTCLWNPVLFQEMVRHGSSLKGHAKKLHGAGRHGHHASNIQRDTLRSITTQASICYTKLFSKHGRKSGSTLFPLFEKLSLPALGATGGHPCADEEIPPQQGDCGQESWNYSGNIYNMCMLSYM